MVRNGWMTRIGGGLVLLVTLSGVLRGAELTVPSLTLPCLGAPAEATVYAS